MYSTLSTSYTYFVIPFYPLYHFYLAVEELKHMAENKEYLERKTAKGSCLLPPIKIGDHFHLEFKLVTSNTKRVVFVLEFKDLAATIFLLIFFQKQ